MARLLNGVFGGFSGKIGNVIGATWRDIWYIKLMPKSVLNPKTKDQMIQRNKFVEIIDLISPCVPILSYGWKKGAREMSEFNAAVSYNLKHAFNEMYEIEPSKVRLSRGPVTPPIGVQLNDASDENTRMIEFTWFDNTNDVWGKADDVALFICIDYEHGLYWWAMCSQRRPQKPGQVINIPSRNPSSVQPKKKQPSVDFPKQDVHCYMAFLSKKGQVSDSTYCGVIGFKEHKSI